MRQGPYTVHQLDNGLRVVVESMPDVRSAAAGFLVRAGARDETPEQAGVSHFLEHMMFKGTPKRTWRDITVDFDRMGSSYNAFTSEERTVYYGWVRRGDLDRQIELLADMMRSTIPAEEFETEKKVILEEIAMSKDNIDHVTFDFIQEKLFAGHPLAWPILGYDATVSALARDTMWHYFRQRYAPDNMVLVVAGAVEAEEVIESARRHCGAWTASGAGSSRVPPTLRTGKAALKTDQFKQQVIALTFPAVGAKDERVETASAVATVLGGDNSRFFWNIVQKGLATRAGAYHMDCTDFGAMILYATCQPEKCDEVLTAIRAEVKRLTDHGVQDHEVNRVKTKRRTSLAVESEAPYHRLTQLMDDMEFHGAPRTVEQMLAEVDAVTADGVQRYLGDYPLTGEGFLASVGPRDWCG